jgi:MFS family permease
MAGLIVVPQIVVALLSPWVGYHSEKWGRKLLLLLGFGLEIIRALLFAFSANVSVLFTAQFLGGISAAAVTVLTILVITDLTTGTGRFNLVRGFIGTLIAIAASISTTATGFLFEALGNWEGFLNRRSCYVAQEPNSDIGQTIRSPRRHALKTSPRSRDQAFWRSSG